ncbi:hypothetical protein IHQ71_06920 [Rhizobium sp. TH2]|uniref:hypothetical protein n=1 Tax=Rhizobium sp. TH2 TaxID=2775403 RepID=UPI00215890DF|nr:hypothetical protein [Rhizobium sp. TH2]UVC10330.1 hypothetical protein IHQ71_06920 [Rhizobium sp. TH2]
MDNLARKDDQAQEFGSFLHAISSVSDVAALDAMCHDFLYRQPPQQGLEYSAGMTWANPFFLPNIPRESLDLLALDRGYFAEMVMRAKLTAARNDRLNVLVTAAPGAAPDFLDGALSIALGLLTANIVAGAAEPVLLGASTLDQEPDEFALIREGLMMGAGYVARHAARCTPYAARMLALYNIRPVVVTRNIFDTIAEIEVAALTDGSAVAAMMPAGFASLGREDRLMLVAGRFAAWIAEFHLSWKRAEREGLVKPLFLSYEADFLGDRHLAARKLAEFLGPKANAMRLSAVLDEREIPAAGAGETLPAAVRDMVARIVRGYAGEEDLSALLD